MFHLNEPHFVRKCQKKKYTGYILSFLALYCGAKIQISISSSKLSDFLMAILTLETGKELLKFLRETF